VQPSLRAEQKELTRRRIVTAARDCFVERGVAETGFNDIARRAGMSRATVYLHFSGKEPLLAAMLEDDWEAQRHLFASVPGPDHPRLQAALADWLQRMQRAYAVRHDAFGLYALALAQDPQIREQQCWQRSALLAELGKWFPAFELSGASSRRRARAYMMLSQIEQYCMLCAAERWQDEIAFGAEAVAAQLFEFVTDGQVD
jgi:AcrR family transcriptional regulator